jgi:hypothetical protein
VADGRGPLVIAHLAPLAETDSGPTRRPCHAVASAGPLAKRVSLGPIKAAAPRCAAPSPQTLAVQPRRTAANPTAAADAALLCRRLATVEEIARSFAAR